MTPWSGARCALVLLAAAAVARCSAPGRLLALPPVERLQDDVEVPQGLPAGMAANAVPPRPWHAAKPQATKPVVRAGDEDLWRLPTNVLPTRYQLNLAVDMAALTFSGNVRIALNVLADTNTIVLHAASNLQFEDASVTVVPVAAGADAVTVTRVARSSMYETVTITLDKALLGGMHYVLTFADFKSPLNTRLSGFYVSTYKTKEGETRYLATTQFESTSARKALPCFDEPSFKARFDVQIARDKAFGVRSNMPELRSEESTDGTTVTTIFDTTVPMSTYLLAWVVSDFKSVSNEGAAFNTWAREDLIGGADISQDVGPRALEELHKYTGIPYALPKTDQFAIPDFNAGAMENWGLVTYREQLLIKTESTDVRYEQEIATVICHELSHQWTGNLVTMDWWSNTWLNEGFATFFENFICDKLHPEMNLIAKSLTSYSAVAMTFDLLDSQHAMSSAVSSPYDIEGKFDRISYAKGGAVLRMFQHVLTPEVFQKGLARYLAANMFKNGTPDRLLRAFDAEVSAANAKTPGTVLLPEGVTFSTVAKTWTEQPGVPLVKVTCDFTAKKCTLTQQQLRQLTSTATVSNKWYIPVTIATSKTASNLKTVAWLTPGAASVTVDIDVGENAADWVIVNPQQTGYYRVSYDAASWARILAAVQSDAGVAVDAETRVQILSDALGLANSEQLELVETVKALQALKGQTNSAVWLAGHSIIGVLVNELANTDVFPSFQILVNSLTDSVFEQTGLQVKEGDDHNTRHLRYFVALYACDGGNAKCLAEAKTMVEELLNNGVALPVDVAQGALCYGVRASDATVFQTVRRELWPASRSDDAMWAAVTTALSCASDPALITGLLNELVAQSPTAQNKQDLRDLLSVLIRYPSQHRTHVVEYFKANLRAITTFFGESGATSSVAQFLVSFIGTIRSDAEYREVQNWVSSSLTGNEYQNVQDALKRVDDRLNRWYRKHYEKVAAYIYEATGTSAPPTPATSPATRPTVPPTRPTSAPGPNTPVPVPASSTPKPNGASIAQASAASLLALVLAVLALAQRSS